MSINYLDNNKNSLKDRNCFEYSSFSAKLVLTSQREAGLLRRGGCFVLSGFRFGGNPSFLPATFPLLETKTEPNVM